MKVQSTDSAPYLPVHSVGFPETAEATLDARRQRLNSIRRQLVRCWLHRRAFAWLPLTVIIVIAVTAVLLFVTLASGDIARNQWTQSVIAFAILGAAASAAAVRYYAVLGTRIYRCIEYALDADDPAVVGPIVSALRRSDTSARTEYLVPLATLAGRIGQAEWKIMSPKDVSDLITCVLDANCEWGNRIGIVAAQSAAMHGEMRAIPPLCEVINNIQRYSCHWQEQRNKLCVLLLDLQAQSAVVKSSNALLRPAEGRPELLRAAADSQCASDPDMLVRPAVVQPVDDSMGGTAQ